MAVGLETWFRSGDMEACRVDRSWRSYAAWKAYRSIDPAECVGIGPDRMTPDPECFCDYYYLFCLSDPTSSRLILLNGGQLAAFGYITINCKGSPKVSWDWCGWGKPKSMSGDFISIDRRVREAAEVELSTAAGIKLLYNRMSRPAMEQLMASRNPHDRAGLAMTLEADDCMRAGDLLDRLAHDESPLVRMALAANIIIPDSTAGMLMDDPDWHVRLAACLGRCAGHWKGMQVAPLLDDPVFDVQVAAAEAMCHSNEDGNYSSKAVSRILGSGCADCIKEAVAAAALEGSRTYEEKWSGEM